MLRRSSAASLVRAFLPCALLAACGSSAAPPAETPPREEPAEPSAPPAPPATSAPLEPTAGADAPPAPSTSDAGDAKPAADPNAQRDIRFVQTPEGLRVEVLGV